MSSYEHDPLKNNHNKYVKPTDVTIVGVRENQGLINEADVMFNDVYGKKWYLTIVSGDQFVADNLNTFDGAEVEDITDPREEEPKKFVWNGPMDEEAIKTIVCSTGPELLAPFVIEIED